jgi:hypothetical protein
MAMTIGAEVMAITIGAEVGTHARVVASTAQSCNAFQHTHVRKGYT